MSIAGQSPWIVARWAFRELLESSSARLDAEADRAVLVQAIALDGLHFDLLPEPQAQRIATAMSTATDDLRRVHREGPEERDREFAVALADLGLLLTGLSLSE